MVQLVFQVIFWSAGLPLTLLVIAAMLRGPYKQFPILFLYVVIGFLLTVAGMPSYIAFYFQHDPDARARMGEWNVWNDAILEPLAYAVVISLIYIAASHVKSRRTVLAVTIGGATLIAGVSFLLHFSPDIGKNGIWMNLWNRDLNFFSEILDLGLWGLLLSTRGRDTRLLMVTGALGIQFTGEAIGEALRSIAAQDRSSHFSPTMSYTGGFLITLADLTALYVFWQAFRKGRNAKAAANGSHVSVERPNSR
jgi:hypothetical protein